MWEGDHVEVGLLSHTQIEIKDEMRFPVWFTLEMNYLFTEMLIALKIEVAVTVIEWNNGLQTTI